jgi:hypothetical protein
MNKMGRIGTNKAPSSHLELNQDRVELIIYPTWRQWRVV